MKKLFLALAAMLMTFSVSAAELNVYASGLKATALGDNKVEISYTLNAQVTDYLTLNLYQGETRIWTLPIQGDANLTKGAHTVTIDLAANQVPVGTYTWAIEAAAARRDSFEKVWESTTILNRLHATVDASPTSPYMGRIYAENRSGSGKGSLYAWNPDFTVLQENFMAGQTKWQSVGRPSVDADGYVWLADYGDDHGGVWVMDPATLEATAFFQGTQNSSNGIWTNTDGVEMGSSSSGCSVYGTGAATKLFMVNEDAGTTLTKNGYCVYNIGQEDGTIDRTWSAAPSQVVAVSDNAGGNFSIAGTSHGAWLCQNRAEPNDASGARSLFFYDNAGKQQFISTNDDAITGSNGGGMAVAATEDKLAIIGTASTIQLYDIAWEGDVPTLTLSASYDCGFAAIGSLAFDYAGNLIASVGTAYGTNMRVAAFATPKAENVCETPAPKASTITVEAEPITLYCKMEHSWWYADGAAVACYAFGDGGENNGAFPGVRMTLVEGEENLWTATIDAKYTKVIFARTSGSGDVANWGAQTADLDIPTDGTNLYTITSAEPVWEGGVGNKVTGEWGIYTPKPAGPTEIGITPNWGEITAGGAPFNIEAWFDVEPSEADIEANLTWSSSRDDVKVYANGGKKAIVMADAEAEAGQVVITVSYGSLSFDAYYIVLPAGPTSLTITPATKTIKSGETLQLTVFADVEGEYYYQWWSENEEYATVDNTGFVTAVSKASTAVTVKIYAQLENSDLQAYAEITIEPNQATALENTELEGKNIRKVIENGQLIIIKDGVRYNAQGAVIE